jgi:hypothetical protein
MPNLALVLRREAVCWHCFEQYFRRRPNTADSFSESFSPQKSQNLSLFSSFFRLDFASVISCIVLNLISDLLI